MTTVPLVHDPLPPAPAGRPRIARDGMSHIAHELNNLLAVIMGHADALDLTLPDTAADRASLDAIRRAARTASDLAEHVRAMGRPPSDSTPSAVSIEPVVRAAGQALDRQYRDRLTVVVHPASRLWTAAVDPALLDDTMGAVVGEAAARVPHGATVSIRLSNAEVGVNRPHLVGSVRRARFVRVEIAVPETAARLGFSRPVGAAAPASTAESCFAALTGAGGRVTIDTDGVCVCLVSLLLPSDGVEARHDAEPAGTAASRATDATSRTILVIDGDGARRALLHKILRAQGFAVLAAATDADVPALAAAHPVDLCIADRPLVWPVDGQASAPPVLYTGRTAVPDDAFGVVAARALPTPFGAAQLVAAVHGVLAAPSGSTSPSPRPFKGGTIQPIHSEDNG